MQLVETIKVNNQLGEGVLWDQVEQTAWWTDIQSNKLYRWQFNGKVEWFPTPERLCSFGLTGEPGWLIGAFESGFAWFHPGTGELQTLCEIESELPGNRMNDGRVDRQGRFWAGSMRERGTGALGGFYKLTGSKAEKMIENIEITNSLCWSIDSRILYYADSPQRQIYQAEFEPEAGKLGPTELFAETEPGAYPDGSCIDSEGCLWNAQWGAGRVRRYDSTGRCLLELEVPCLQPSCVAFGGPELKHLFVTSARQDLSDAQLDEQSGNLFVFATPYQGLEEPLYAWKRNERNEQ